MYRHLALFVRGLKVSLGNGRWLMSRHVSGRFRMKGTKATGLAETLRGVISDVVCANGVLYLSEGRAFRLVEMGLPNS